MTELVEWRRCPKCGAEMIHGILTVNPPIPFADCPKCGYHIQRDRGTTVDTRQTQTEVILTDPNNMTTSKEFLETHASNTDIDDLTTRVSALEAELEKLKSIIRTKDEQSESQKKSTKDDLTLRPCPFCGGKVGFREMRGVECEYFTIHCTKCGMSCTKYEKWGAIDMVEDWNRRVNE